MLKNNLIFVKKNNEIKINLSKKIYSYKALKETLDVFNDFCYGLIKKGNRLQITLKLRKKFNEKLAYEFCNYALGLTLQNRKNEKLL